METPEELIDSLIDSHSADSEDSANKFDHVHIQFIQRNKLLTGLLTEYIHSIEERYRKNKTKREILFWTFFAFLIALTVVVVVVLLKTDFNEITIPSVVSLFSVGATYLGSLFAIYKIMFKYLFPSDEEKDTITMIKTVIENDVEVEKIFLGNEKEYMSRESSQEDL